METEHLANRSGSLPFSDGDESEYRTSEGERSQSDGERYNESAPPASKRGRKSTSSKKRRNRSRDDEDLLSEEEDLEDAEEQTFENAKSWAANFKAPGSPSEIESPKRSVSRSRKRKLEKPPSQTRAKRLKRYHNTEYRELLNIDINDVATRMVHSDEKRTIPKSQIGISLWTSQEKERFFSALQRLGPDDILGISNRIQTKSEPEVRAYILLLQQAATERRSHSGRTLPLTDIPGALEISGECCVALDMAGAALSSRQELAEEETEKAKWGDTWLLTPSVASRLDKYRRSGGGEVDISSVLPASDLFKLQTWLELSSRVFMNSAEAGENWKDVVEEGEVPAVRTTAMEDFHSLAVSITKRLVQTTLFVTMSREKSTGSKKVKQAEITPRDVEAAAAMLKMKTSSEEFWVKAARRNRVRVVDDEEEDMGYAEVEEALRPEQREREGGEQDEEDDNSDLPSVSSDNDSGESSGFESDASNRPERAQKRALTKLAALDVEESVVNAYDMRASREEESRLWLLMGQEPLPLEEEVAKVKGFKEGMEGQDWRERTERVAAWEVNEKVVPEQAFEKNRREWSRKARRRWEREVIEDGQPDEREVDDDGDVSERLAVESHDEESEQPVLDSGSEDAGDMSERLESEAEDGNLPEERANSAESDNEVSGPRRLENSEAEDGPESPYREQSVGSARSPKEGEAWDDSE